MRAHGVGRRGRVGLRRCRWSPRRPSRGSSWKSCAGAVPVLADVVVEPGQRPAALEGVRRVPHVELARLRASSGCAPTTATSSETGVPCRLQRRVGGDRLLQVEQGVGLALAEQGGHPDVASCSSATEFERRNAIDGLARVAQRADLGSAVHTCWSKLAQSWVDEGRARRRRVGAAAAGPGAPSATPTRREQRRPLVLEDAGAAGGRPNRCAPCRRGSAAVLRGEGVGEVVPGDQRDDRVEPVRARAACS